MLRGLRQANLFTILFDFLGTVILGLYALVVGPLGILRGPLGIEKGFSYSFVLLPQGLLARSIRTAIDWRLGNFDTAITQLEALVGSNEDYYRERPTAFGRKRVLEDLYTILVRAYLHAGHIDDAMLAIIRAKKTMGIERLPGLSELDAKTAHLVRAGLAAGRLLEGGSLANMFVKSQQKKPPEAPKPQVHGASRRPLKPLSPSRDGARDDNMGAKIIPFPGDDSLKF